MPRRHEGPRRDKVSGFYVFDEAVGFGTDKCRIRFSLRTQDPLKAQFLWEREFRRQWDIYYGIEKPARLKPTSFIEAGKEYIAFLQNIKRIKEWGTVRERLNIILDIIGDIDIQKFGAPEITAIDHWLTAHGRAQKTINHYMTHLRAFFNWAIRENRYRGENPLREVRPYIVDRKRREYSADELSRIIKAAGKIQGAARKGAVVERNIQRIVLLLLLTGMRLGELLNLRWENIQEDKIVISRSETKQKKEKIVPISGRVAGILDSLLKSRQRGDYVLSLVRVGRKRPAWCYDAMRKIRQLSGVPDFTFHGLRHTAATIMVSETLGRGVGLADIMKILGHSRSETTLQYQHEDFGRMKKAVEALEKVK